MALCVRAVRVPALLEQSFAIVRAVGTHFKSCRRQAVRKSRQDSYKCERGGVARVHCGLVATATTRTRGINLPIQPFVAVVLTDICEIIQRRIFIVSICYVRDLR
jgi:hypothetical protein